MRQLDATVQGDRLTWSEEAEERSILVGTEDWYAWLEKATSFSYAGPLGNFTARKESRQRGGWYWSAYRKRSGRLQRAYLGKSEDLILDRLLEVAKVLSKIDVAEVPKVHRDKDIKPQGQLSDLGPGTSVWSNGERADSSRQDVQLDPLLVTKLTLPPFRADLVGRPRLIERLNEALRKRLTLISAPVGFGKTSLLSQWIQQLSCPLAWLSLETSDNDPARFWTYIVAALQVQRPHAGASALTLLRSSQGRRFELFLTAFLNDLAVIPGDQVIVLDDYHVVETQAIHDALTFFIDHLPPHVHLVVVSRTDPTLPLATLRGRGQLVELRSADLAFNREETATFLQQVMNLDLADEDVALLEQRSEGWITGLQLAALSFDGRQDIHSLVRAFSGDHRYILGYLTEQVFRRQPEAVQTFLLQTSILDRLSGKLCEAVTGLADCQGILEMLERSNLFTVSLDNEQRWYRYHHLFAEFLKSSLTQSDPRQLPELHRRARAWYTENGLLTEAIGHALAAGEFDLAADLLEKTARVLLERGEYITIMNLTKGLPDEQLRARPHLLLTQAWALTFLWEIDAAEARLQEVEHGVGRIATDPQTDPTASPAAGSAEVQRLLDEVTAVRALVACFRSDWRPAMALALKALERWSDDEPFVLTHLVWALGMAYSLSGDLVKANEKLAEARVIGQSSPIVRTAVVALTQQADLYASRAQLNQAVVVYRQAAQMADDLGIKPNSAKCAPYVGLSRVLYEWNDLDGVMRYAAEGLELGKKAGNLIVVLNAYSALARLKQAQGNSEAALGLLQLGEQVARINIFTEPAALLSSYRARLCLENGDLGSAAQWAREARSVLMNSEPTQRQMGQFTALARVLAATGEFAEAMEALNRLLRATETSGRTAKVIKILALQASILQAHDHTDQALPIIERSLLLARSERYVRTFLDEGAPMAALLSRFLQCRMRDRGTRHDDLCAYVRALLAEFEASPLSSRARWGGERTITMVLNPLTERELEVLRLIVAGLPDREIARQLVVSLNTAKTHIKNVYNKLDVHTRQEAAALAHTYKLHQNPAP